MVIEKHRGLIFQCILAGISPTPVGRSRACERMEEGSKEASPSESTLVDSEAETDIERE